MKKYWPLILASAVLLAYHYSQAMWLLFLPKGTIIFNDFALLTYQGNAARNFYAASHTFWGYDPNFMAGYPLTFIWNSNVAVQVLCVLFKYAEIEVVIRSFLFASIMLFPLGFYWSMRNFRFTVGEAWAGAIIGTLVFRFSLPMMFHLTGMITAGAITWLSILLFSLLYRYCTNPNVRNGIVLLIFSALGLLVHKTIVVIIFVPALVLFIQHVRKMRFIATAALVLIGAAAVAANWFWIGPMLAFMKYKTFLWEAPFWVNLDPLRPFKDFFTLSIKMNTVEWRGWYGATHTLMMWALVIGGVAGLAAFRKKRDPRFLPLACTAAFLFIFGYYGSFIKSFVELNPTRYLPVFTLLMVMPATASFISVYRRIGSKLAAGTLFLAVACGGALLTHYHLQRFDQLLLIRLNTPETEPVTKLVEKLRSLPPGGRVLLEDSGVMDREGGGQIYALSHIPALFPKLTGRQFIGGPYPYVFLKFHEVEFHDGILFGKDIENYSLETLKQRIELFDIKWVVAWSTRSRFYFDSYPQYFKPEWSQGPFRLYSAPRVPNMFLKGAGYLTATYNRLELSNLQPERGEVIIKYHWIDTLRTEPPCAMDRADVPGDPIGFIRLKNPPERVVIVNP